jgi:hypothetical protein
LQRSKQLTTFSSITKQIFNLCINERGVESALEKERRKKKKGDMKHRGSGGHDSTIAFHIV